MSRIFSSARELIGSTPIVELCGLEKRFSLSARLLAKCEMLNPGGSAKDRVALKMIDDAEKAGKLVPGSVIIEPTSGNTGIGLAAVGAARGYRVVIIMPDSMPPARAAMMRAYGAEVVMTPGKLGMSGAVEAAKELAAKTANAFLPDQFSNPSNSSAHYAGTGPEIWRDLDGGLDFFVAGIGTGGTITGVGRYLKEKNPDIRVIGVEPFSSPFLTTGKSGPHGIPGIGAGFLPKVLDMSAVDEIFTVTDGEAAGTKALLAKCEGLLAGTSSGAAVCAAIKIAQSPENTGKTVVALLPDSGDRELV